MKCPFCKSNDDMVIDSRPLDSFAVVRRRRKCGVCAKRYTTYERIESIPIMVLKNNGKKEPFDINRVRTDIENVCKKRNISQDTIENIVDEIEKHATTIDVKELSSKELGEKIIAKLKDLDDVAYLRFASVYREFANLDDFSKEIDTLKSKQTV